MLVGLPGKLKISQLFQAFFFFFHEKYNLSRRVLLYSVRCKGAGTRLANNAHEERVYMQVNARCL